MAEINGADVLLRVNTGTYAVPVWTTVGSQQDVDFGETSDMIDVSSKNSRSRKLLYGRYSASVTLSYLYIPDAADLAALKAAIRGGTVMKIRRQYSGTDIEEADCLVADKKDTFPDQAPATGSVTLEVSGDWAAV